MGTTDERIDAYIGRSAAFAQPVLAHLRKLVHTACPGVEETIKWGFPHFDYCGEILCSMASFKKHCTFGFWKASIMSDPRGLIHTVGKTSMGNLGQITHISELPSDSILKQYIKEAARLNKEGIKLPSKTKTTAQKAIVIPADLKAALNANKEAQKIFAAFSDTNKKEYVNWITEAKTETTRAKRLQTAIEWMAEGKIRHWKYN